MLVLRWLDGALDSLLTAKAGSQPPLGVRRYWAAAASPQCYALRRPSSRPKQRGQRVQSDGSVGVLCQLVNKYNSV